MNSFEIQKIVSAILITVLVVFGIGKISDFFFNKDPELVVAYKVDPPEGMSDKKEVGSSELDLKAMFALADLAHGEKVFKKCTACHQIAVGGKNMIGPNLWGVIGRTSGSVSDYKYSKAMIAHGKEWSFEEMNSYLIKPQAHIKGTKMAFAGLRKEKDRASVILYMNSKSNNPKPLP